ncbi:MAG: MerR family transcriptional regulator [Defluviitaleaceae bacterium]|nr:MerR family transcriptional regulator [Defluviitaleaceae bacterium]
MFKIGEFSRLVRVSARMLRHYDKCGLLRPVEVDRFTGYRLYSAEQIPLLIRITALRDMGFGVEEIEETLPYYNNAEFMLKALEQKRKQIDSIIEMEQHKLDKINDMNNKIRKGNDRMVYEVELKEIPAIKVVSLREIVAAFENEVEQWEKMWAFIKKHNINCTKTGYSIYHDDEYKDENIDMEIAVPVNDLAESCDGFVYKELEAIPLAATIRFPGPYDNYGKAMEKLAVWIEQNGYEFDGIIRGHGIVMPDWDVAFENTLTELQVPVKKVNQ